MRSFLLPPSETMHVSPPSVDEMIVGVESRGPPFSLEYSQTLALWDLARTSNMSGWDIGLNNNTIADRPEGDGQGSRVCCTSIPPDAAPRHP